MTHLKPAQRQQQVGLLPSAWKVGPASLDLSKPRQWARCTHRPFPSRSASFSSPLDIVVLPTRAMDVVLLVCTGRFRLTVDRQFGRCCDSLLR